MNFTPNGELVPVGGGDPVPLIRETLVVGRREACDIRLNFPNVSSIHCELSFQNGFWYIRDRNSTNGVRVNGVRVSRKLLMPDDQVSIATRDYTIHYNAPANKPPADDLEDDILSQSLLERAGLEKPQRRDDSRRAK